jgi:hypothetical protein
VTSKWGLTPLVTVGQTASLCSGTLRLLTAPYWPDVTRGWVSVKWRCFIKAEQCNSRLNTSPVTKCRHSTDTVVVRKERLWQSANVFTASRKKHECKGALCGGQWESEGVLHAAARGLRQQREKQTRTNDSFLPNSLLRHGLTHGTRSPWLRRTALRDAAPTTPDTVPTCCQAIYMPSPSPSRPSAPSKGHPCTAPTLRAPLHSRKVRGSKCLRLRVLATRAAIRTEHVLTPPHPSGPLFHPQNCESAVATCCCRRRSPLQSNPLRSPVRPQPNCAARALTEKYIGPTAAPLSSFTFRIASDVTAPNPGRTVFMRLNTETHAQPVLMRAGKHGRSVTLLPGTALHPAGASTVPRQHFVLSVLFTRPIWPAVSRKTQHNSGKWFSQQLEASQIQGEKAAAACGWHKQGTVVSTVNQFPSLVSRDTFQRGVTMSAVCVKRSQHLNERCTHREWVPAKVPPHTRATWTFDTYICLRCTLILSSHPPTHTHTHVSTSCNNISAHLNSCYTFSPAPLFVWSLSAVLS